MHLTYCPLSHSLKNGQHPSSSLGFCCPVFSHCHKLGAGEFTTARQSFHSAADTNLQTGLQRRAGAVTTSLQHCWVGCGLRGSQNWNPGFWSRRVFFGRSLLLCQDFQWRDHRGKNPCCWGGQAPLIREKALGVYDCTVFKVEKKWQVFNNSIPERRKEVSKQVAEFCRINAAYCLSFNDTMRRLFKWFCSQLFFIKCVCLLKCVVLSPIQTPYWRQDRWLNLFLSIKLYLMCPSPVFL